MTKQEIKDYLTRGGMLYVVGLRRGTNKRTDKGMWRYFCLYIANHKGLKKITFDEEVLDINPPPNIRLKGFSYEQWDLPKQFYIKQTVSTDRTFDLINEFSEWLFGKTSCIPFKYQLLN